MNHQTHWDDIFNDRPDHQKSWFQSYPSTSMKLIAELGLPLDAAIIDVGGGDSRLADALLQKGFTDITILDISKIAIEKAQHRLGNKARQVHWIVADILNFTPDRHYDCWHDRAVFHFTTRQRSIRQYTRLMADTLLPNSALILGTFAEDGPDRCSGLPVKRYSQTKLINLLQPSFEKLKCIHDRHVTPYHTVQSFTFCSFRRA